jgi:hypothetical protein
MGTFNEFISIVIVLGNTVWLIEGEDGVLDFLHWQVPDSALQDGDIKAHIMLRLNCHCIEKQHLVRFGEPLVHAYERHTVYGLLIEQHGCEELLQQLEKEGYESHLISRLSLHSENLSSRARRIALVIPHFGTR